jgi:proliferating cell nuclear antigen
MTEESTAPLEAIVEAQTLKNFVAPIDTIADEFRLHLDDDGFSVTVCDPAQVAMTRVELGEEAFESYHASGGEIGIPLSRDGGLDDTLDFADPEDLVSLRLDPETRALEIEFGTVEMELACIDSKSIRSEPDIDDLDLAVDVTFHGDQFAEAIDICDMVSNYIIVEGQPDQSRWVMRAEGDTDAVDSTFEREDLVEGQVPEEHQTLLSADYLTSMVKSVPNSAEVRFRHGTELPAKWWYSVGEADVMALLAPRIQS